MKKISSKWTQYNKKLFPAIWFGFLAVFLVTSLFDGAAEASIVFVAAPLVMMVFGFFLMKKLVWDLVDEVYDAGDYLLVRNRGKEERINLANVINVNVSTMVNPPRITLRLEKPSRLGPEVAFSPDRALSLNPFAKNQIGEDLILRVDRARRKSA